MADLSTELEVYKKALPSLVGEEGKFVVIGEGKLLGIYSAYSDALQAAYKEFGLKPFLVKQITAQEQIAYFSRDFDSACRV